MKTKYCIIGTGIAGMSAALRLSEYGDVILITKKKILSGSTPLAQGGIAAVFPEKNSEDSFDHHIADTLKAGHYKNNIEAVKLLVHNAPKVMQDLASWGVKFSPHLHLEGGHSAHRIFNTGDTTGKTIAQGLRKKIIESKNITLLDDTYALDIICNEENGKKIAIGVALVSSGSKPYVLYADEIIFATGGYASIFKYATSPSDALGDGIAIAIRAGIEVRDLSKIQFHPTVLARRRSPRLLLSEALRGAGALIVDSNNTPLIDPLKPRDVIAQAIIQSFSEGKKIYLDARPIKDFEKKFPYLFYALTQDFLLDPTKDLLPIVPAAHYCMGGIVTDLDGCTSISNVYATGECAYTGVHGENRLASNSLVEGLVFSRQIARHLSSKNIRETSQSTSIDISFHYPEDKITLSSRDKKNVIWIQENFSRFLGVERDRLKVEKLAQKISSFQMETQEGKNFLTVVTATIIDILESL